MPIRTNAELLAELRLLAEKAKAIREGNAKAAGMTVEQMDKEFEDLVLWGFREGPAVQSVALVKDI